MQSADYAGCQPSESEIAGQNVRESTTRKSDLSHFTKLYDLLVY